MGLDHRLSGHRPPRLSSVYLPHGKCITYRSSSSIAVVTARRGRHHRHRGRSPVADAGTVCRAGHHQGADPRRRTRPLHRAGLRQDVAAPDRREAGVLQGGALLPLRQQGRHPDGAAPAPARARQGVPGGPGRRALGPRRPGVPMFEGFISVMIENRKVFVLHERNRAAFENLHRKEHDDEHSDLEERSGRCCGTVRSPSNNGMRMACALGAVMGGLVLAGDAFADVSPRRPRRHAPARHRRCARGQDGAGRGHEGGATATAPGRGANLVPTAEPRCLPASPGRCQANRPCLRNSVPTAVDRRASARGAHGQLDPPRFCRHCGRRMTVR